MRLFLFGLQWMCYLSGLFTGWWFLIIPCTFWLVWSHGLLIPVVVAVLADGYFGAWNSIPYLTVSVIVLGSALLFIRPYFYTIR